MPTDPKPAKRIKDPALVRNFSIRAAECCICGASRADGRISAHHVYPRSQGGDDVVANLVALCGDGVSGCHGDVEHHRNEARARLADHLCRKRPDVLAYLDDKLGVRPALDFLVRRYGVTV